MGLPGAYVGGGNGGGCIAQDRLIDAHSGDLANAPPPPSFPLNALTSLAQLGKHMGTPLFRGLFHIAFQMGGALAGALLVIIVLPGATLVRVITRLRHCRQTSAFLRSVCVGV